MNTFAYRETIDAPEAPEAIDAPRRPHGGQFAYRRGLVAGVALATRLAAEAETVPEAILVLNRALNAAAEARDDPGFVDDLAGTIARRAARR